MDRRTFLRSTAATAGALTLGPAFWRQAFAAPAQPGPVYGPLGPPDANGIRLPPGFTSRVVARSGDPVSGTDYTWHNAPDGGATFALDHGGWIYVSNSEIPLIGGVGAITFAANGAVIGAHRVISNTTQNCAGGPTPWGTWLTCEEYPAGHVWECDPRGPNVNATALRLALGTFQHEAVAVDPVRRHLYLTEDQPDGLLYRFTPTMYPSLIAGRLEAAVLRRAPTYSESDPRWRVTWARVPNPNIVPGNVQTRHQVPEARTFQGGEGIWYGNGSVYFATKIDNRVWAFDTTTSEMSLLYDRRVSANPILRGVDNVVVSNAGEVVVAEDGGDMKLVVFSADGATFAPLLQVVGQNHSELAGPAFNPAGDRLYFSSQRGPGPGGRGITYEITGPFATGPYTGAVLPDVGTLSGVVHNTVEPVVRAVSPQAADAIHTVDRTLRRFGL